MNKKCPICSESPLPLGRGLIKIKTINNALNEQEQFKYLNLLVQLSTFI